MPKCPSCETVVSFDVPRCPSCGAQDPGKAGPGLLFGLAYLGGLIGSVVLLLLPAVLISWSVLPPGTSAFAYAPEHAWTWAVALAFWGALGAALAWARSSRRRRHG